MWSGTLPEYTPSDNGKQLKDAEDLLPLGTLDSLFGQVRESYLNPGKLSKNEND